MAYCPRYPVLPSLRRSSSPPPPRAPASQFAAPAPTLSALCLQCSQNCSHLLPRLRFRNCSVECEALIVCCCPVQAAGRGTVKALAVPVVTLRCQQVCTSGRTRVTVSESRSRRLIRVQRGGRGFLILGASACHGVLLLVIHAVTVRC
jgi:hypothetical protein